MPKITSAAFAGCVLVLCLAGCGGDSAKPMADAGGSDAAADAAAMCTSPAPAGMTCPPTAGNCLGVGKPCTMNGKECDTGLSCDKDLSANGKGICIRLFG